MLKRLSTFRSKKDSNEHANRVNTVSGHHDSHTADGANGLKDPRATQRFSSGTPKNEQSSADSTTTLEGVASSFNKFAQLVHASKKPLLTQEWDDPYLTEDDVPSSLLQVSNKL
jgi:hypothetical protein